MSSFLGSGIEVFWRASEERITFESYGLTWSDLMNFDFLRQFRQIGTASATNTATTTAKTTPTTMAAITAVGRELLPGSLGGSLSMILIAELQLLTKKPLLERICVS